MSSTSGGGNALLLRFIESHHFSLFLCVSYLERYADNIGIHSYLCKKIRAFNTNDVEFFLPQLVQLHVTVDTESMALEDLLLDLCNESTHCTLLVFWQLQAHLTELSSEPDTYGFKVCKRLYNKLQYLLFNVGDAPNNKIKENTSPGIILAATVAAGIGMPLAPQFIKPVVLSQGRKQRSHIFHLASKLLRSKSTSNVGGHKPAGQNENAHAGTRTPPRSKDDLVYRNDPLSLPDLNISMRISPFIEHSSHESLETDSPRESHPEPPSREMMIRQLRTNYFRCETQFMYALQSISTRLLQVPPQARQSALRIELALLNRDLPAEVDIPLLLPTKGSDSNGRLNRIVRVSPAEATVLNSAEKVPFLLLIEYLKDELDFDPASERNQSILLNQDDRRYIFDLAYLHDQQRRESQTRPRMDHRAQSQLELGSTRANGLSSQSASLPNSPTVLTSRSTPHIVRSHTLPVAPLEEKDMGDLSVMGMFEDDRQEIDAMLSRSLAGLPARTSQLAVEDHSVPSPRPSDLSFSSQYFTYTSPDLHPAEITDRASHMRTAATMLAQLESNRVLPRDEAAAIKARIITNMQNMDFTVSQVSLNADGAAGERKMENDLKTGGMVATNQTPKEHSDDPSAKWLGEDWVSKKERIRRTSPYGHLANWDLFSCIAKTGGDLRQEALACQLIEAMNKAWTDAKVGTWVKKMRILITSENTGLVETITNGLSIHSIKKALTSATMAAGENPKGTIASLSDHFSKTFGEPGSQKHNCALECFVRSLAAYSIISYILQIKDRHNGNILLDNEGHVIHIDFGFMLSNSPGGKFGVEAAPFKFTQEYVDLMGGLDSEYFAMFKDTLKSAFKTLRKHAESIIILVEMMGRDSSLPCFSLGPATYYQLRQRFQLQLSDPEADQFVETYLIQKSMGSIYTRLYDQFQLVTQGIYS